MVRIKGQKRAWKEPTATTRKDAERNADRTGLTAKTPSKGDAARNKNWSEAQDQLKLKRFTVPLMRGVVYGSKRRIIITAKKVTKKGKTRYIGEYDGPGVVWATIMADNNLQLRDWPQNRKGPSQMTSLLNVNIEDREYKTTKALARRASETAAQLKAAEYHANADKAISRHEALLATKFQGCFDAAVNFVQYTGLLTVPPDQGPVTWPKDQQVRGRQLHERLVGAYGIGCFPCREVTGISANFFRQVLRLDPAQAAILNDTSLYDAWLFLFGLKLWRIHGSKLTRNCLTNLPIPANRTLPTQDECTAARADHFGRNVITSMAHIASLSNISPIANEAMAPDAALRDPRKMGAGPQVSPKLAPPTQRIISHTDKYFAGWVSYFYDGAPEAAGLETMGLETMPVPTVPESLASVTMMRSRDTREHPNETARLNEISHKLRNHTHLAIVIMIWRDFLIPAASNGLMETIDRYYEKLRLAAKGVNPDNMEDEEWEEPESDDDEEDNE